MNGGPLLKHAQALLLLDLFVLHLAACEPRGDSSPKTERLVIFAAASLREVFTSFEAEFEAAHRGTDVVLHFAGTQELRAQLERGAEADVFAGADWHHAERLVGAKLLESPVVFARNEPVVIATHDSAPFIQGFVDLPRAERLAFGTPEVPIGRYTARIIEGAALLYGEEFRRSVEAHVVSHELNVKQILARVSLGEVDAGIVYATDARAARTKVRNLRVPERLNVVAEYPIALVSSSKRQVQGRGWIELTLSPSGQRRLKDAGFLSKPRGEAL